MRTHRNNVFLRHRIALLESRYHIVKERLTLLKRQRTMLCLQSILR